MVALEHIESIALSRMFCGLWGGIVCQELGTASEGYGPRGGTVPGGGGYCPRVGLWHYLPIVNSQTPMKALPSRNYVGGR